MGGNVERQETLYAGSGLPAVVFGLIMKNVEQRDIKLLRMLSCFSQAVLAGVVIGMYAIPSPSTRHRRVLPEGPASPYTF